MKTQTTEQIVGKGELVGKLGKGSYQMKGGKE